MRPLLRPLVLALALVATGCLAADPAPPLPPADGAPDAAPLLPALDVALAPTRCDLGLLIFLTSMDQAQKHLPAGFTARDAQAVLGAPAATGKGAIAVANLACDESAFGSGYAVGELLILVNAPKVNASLEPTTLDYYAPALHVAEGPLRELATRAGFPPIEGEMTLDVQMRPALGGAARGALAGADAAVWEFDIQGAAPITATALERIWHASPGGLAFIENDYANSAFLGRAECALGGIAAEVVGATSCAGGEMVAAVVPPQTWTARLATLPGVHAE